MKIKFLGHSCFLITDRDGLRIITDPYTTGEGISYSPIEEAADIVLVSHEHGDHNNVSVVRGKPDVVKHSGTKTVRGIEFRGIDTYHDSSQGKQRGPNTAFCFTLDEIRVCHLGDLGHLLSPKQVAEIGKLDILLIPVGGFFTIDASEATQVCHQLSPRIIIPMHFKTPKCAYPIAGVDDFLKGKGRIRRLLSSETEFAKAAIPDPALSEVVVLQPAL